tara:strand:- start:106 stop:438 length:333 start_codon:yes stop_codon:yes gene_type:complete
MNDDELLEKPDGVHKDKNGVEVLVESDKMDNTRKNLFVKSNRLFVDNKSSWIPRKELTTQERKKLLKECMDMEKTFIKMHRETDEFFRFLNNSDLFMYHRMLNEVVRPQS